eukprot:CAMPEP_0170085326 /NCGR_PEP_ID=MMETSP0019_2-20121128/20242_1 /TAXON_ID=98059 /ORGANISM="Dinobryon sp., Strain UTEXLB2267" /LENGTH=432 /DNA_ID=CAMNT_0010301741 /DNA_START=285 /DNA_END=1583 /DNA_ORIENTATION=+
MYKLGMYLKRHFENSTLSKSQHSGQSVYDIIERGYQCSALQASQQEVISKFISMDICSEIEWYKLVQLTWPSAQLFMDVGANKGYLGSLFLALWGGNGLQVSPAVIFEEATRRNTWKHSRNPAGYCKDGHSRAIQLHCPPPHRRLPLTGACEGFTNSAVRVVSFDGSSFLARTLTHFIQHLLPQPRSLPLGGFNASLDTLWRYLHRALSDREGRVFFPRQDSDFNAGFEGGSIRLRRENNDSRLEEVPMTSVDAFLAGTGLDGPRLDVLKIDTEGNDNKVLLGARAAIREAVGLLTFEGGLGVTLSRDMLRDWDLQGFSCYSTSRAGLFKWSGGCMKERYMGGFSAKDKGNIFCVHRERAGLTALAFDVLAFPMMIEAHNAAGNALEDAERRQFREAMQRAGDDSKVDPRLLTQLYVNIRPFCKPFPACAAI